MLSILKQTIDQVDKIGVAKGNKYARYINNIFDKPSFTDETYLEKLENFIAIID